MSPGMLRMQVPADLEHAVILLFGHFNANREAVIASERASGSRVAAWRCSR
jgi:hypothetical protein